MEDIQTKLRRQMQQMNANESPDKRAARLFPERVALCSAILPRVSQARERHPEWKDHAIITMIESDLKRGCFRSRGAQIESYVLQFGRPFFGNPQSPKYRKGRAKRCFVTCGNHATEGRGTYVEGFAITPDSPMLIHHAWLTSDGTDAVEVTWKSPAEKNHYFGLPVSSQLLSACMCESGRYGIFDEGKDPPVSRALATYLARQGCAA